jgi:1-aminocyclopropane-1-carboxylate deaminase/D-cysteine desulfhydrase-like pyridoxal-dependent ACC family enzyme
VSLDDFNRVQLLFGPSPVHPLDRLTEHLGGEVDATVMMRVERDPAV